MTYIASTYITIARIAVAYIARIHIAITYIALTSCIALTNAIYNLVLLRDVLMAFEQYVGDVLEAFGDALEVFGDVLGS